MKSDEFDELVKEENRASVEMLKAKAAEYATDDDRLSNFKEAAGLRNIHTTDALVGMLVKHWVSVSDMAKDPFLHCPLRWDEKLRDCRNYTYLLKALLKDLGIG
jgi:hypothetical protein